MLQEARIVIGHGQLHEGELEHAVRKLYQQSPNLLLVPRLSKSVLTYGRPKP